MFRFIACFCYIIFSAAPMLQADAIEELEKVVGSFELKYDLDPDSYSTHLFLEGKEELKLDNHWYGTDFGVFRMGTSAHPVMVMPLSAGEGTSCPQLLRLLRIDRDGMSITEQFGNCSDFVSVIREDDIYHFLFSCLCSGECYERYASYLCSFSLENGLQCEGEDHCSRYTCESSEPTIFFESSVDSEHSAEAEIMSGKVKRVNCYEVLEQE